jgi:hypothetical protein
LTAEDEFDGEVEAAVPGAQRSDPRSGAEVVRPDLAATHTTTRAAIISPEDLVERHPRVV